MVSKAYEKRIASLTILVSVIFASINLTAKNKAERLKMLQEMRECFAALGVLGRELDIAMNRYSG